MDVDSTVRRSLWHFPSLYADRTDVIEHLLLSPGCGYEWVGGQLVTDFDHEAHAREHRVFEDPEEDFADTIARWEADEDRMAEIHADGVRSGRNPQDSIYERETLGAERLQYWRKLAAERTERVRMVRSSIDDRVRLHRVGPTVQSLPVSPYALINHIPDDVHEDWLQACEEIAALLASTTHSTAWRDPASFPFANVGPANTPEELAEDAARVAANHLVAARAQSRIRELRR